VPGHVSISSHNQSISLICILKVSEIQCTNFKWFILNMYFNCLYFKYSTALKLTKWMLCAQWHVMPVVCLAGYGWIPGTTGNTSCSNRKALWCTAQCSIQVSKWDNCEWFWIVLELIALLGQYLLLAVIAKSEVRVVVISRQLQFSVVLCIIV